MSDSAEEAAIIGVHFKPGGAFGILGPLAGELANTHVDLRTIWGPAADTLRERLCTLSQPIDRFRLLERALLQRLLDGPHRHGAVRAGLDVLMRTYGQTTIRDVARAVDLSQRRFVEVFAAEVGLTPKLFGRIQRFQYALASLRKATEVDWAQFAVECGYFDQSHLIHELIELAGLSPVEYRRQQNRLDRAGLHVKRHHLPLAH